MNYASRPVQLALFAGVLNDPAGSVKEVKHAMEQLLTKRWPNGRNRPVVVEDKVFASVTAAAYWLHFKNRYLWVKAQNDSPQNLHKIIDNLMSLIRNRCDAMDYEWTGGKEGRKGVWSDSPCWCWYEVDIYEGFSGKKDAGGNPVSDTYADYFDEDLRGFDYTSLKLK